MSSRVGDAGDEVDVGVGTAPGAQSPKIEAISSWWPVNASGVAAYRLTEPVTFVRLRERGDADPHALGDEVADLARHVT